uniref:hemagglutinin repeat-containing protein n=1 Tax=Komagataeibacter piraceti TaxID=3229897 RepID=UPI003B5BF0AC
MWGSRLAPPACHSFASQDIEQHDYSHRAAETENFGASISTGGNLTVAALGGDLTLAGATVAAGKSATLLATGNVNLNAVTDNQSSYSDSRPVRSCRHVSKFHRAPGKGRSRCRDRVSGATCLS